MKSSIKIDFIDRGTGKGIEPVIRVEIIDSEDPRDTLVSYLFESLRGQSYLQLSYSNHKHVLSPSGYPDIEKTVVLFKPEINTDELMSIVDDTFGKWLGEEKYVQAARLGKNGFTNGDEFLTDEQVFEKFISIKAIHGN